MSEIKSKRNFPLAVISGLAAAAIAACLWAAATYLTGFRLMFMPIAIGLIVGYSVRLLGKGTTFPFGLIGAVFTSLSCFVGHLLAITAAAAAVRNTSVFAILSTVVSSKIDVEFFAETFSVTELVSYAVAVGIGFILSFYRFNRRKTLQPVSS